LVTLFFAPYRDPLRIREMGRELASCQKLNRNTQQPEIDDSSRRDVGERARGLEECGEMLSHHLGEDWDKKKYYKMNHAKA
jgi:hypothetical protein